MRIGIRVDAMLLLSPLAGITSTSKLKVESWISSPFRSANSIVPSLPLAGVNSITIDLDSPGLKMTNNSSSMKTPQSPGAFTSSL